MHYVERNCDFDPSSLIAVGIRKHLLGTGTSARQNPWAADIFFSYYSFSRDWLFKR